jgi:hypothetical protein
MKGGEERGNTYLFISQRGRYILKKYNGLANTIRVLFPEIDFDHNSIAGIYFHPFPSSSPPLPSPLIYLSSSLSLPFFFY